MRDIPKGTQLKKERRIRKNKEYRLVYKYGRYEVGRYCVVYRMPVAKQATRIGFVTGKKVGGAVERNRARRLLKEVYRLNQHLIKEEVHIVVVGRNGIAQASYDTVERDLMRVFKRIKVLKNSES